MIDVRFRFESKKAKQVVSQVMVQDALQRCFFELRLKTGEVHIFLIGDRAMQTLNRRFRKKNKPTDVLSFPTGEGLAFPKVGEKDFGDIFINWQDIAERKKTKLGRYHLSAFLAVHGALHLLGFDHHTKSSRAAMRKLEKKICGEYTFYK